MKTPRTSAPIGWGVAPPPTPSALAATQRRMRAIREEILSIPNLLPALKAKDLVERYGIGRSAAYQVLRRARNLHVKHAVSGVEQGRAG
jgi:hypothetical protein